MPAAHTGRARESQWVSGLSPSRNNADREVFAQWHGAKQTPTVKVTGP